MYEFLPIDGYLLANFRKTIEILSFFAILPTLHYLKTAFRMQTRVVAYLTRQGKQEKELLVCRASMSQAALMVPCGLVEPTETALEALYRHVEDQAGLVHLRVIKKLHEFVRPGKRVRFHKRVHAFEVASLEQPAAYWTYQVKSYDERRGEKREYFWLPVSEAIPHLSSLQAESVNCILHKDKASTYRRQA